MRRAPRKGVYLNSGSAAPLFKRCFISLRQASKNQRRGRRVLDLRLERHAGLEARRHRTHGLFASPRLIGLPFSRRRGFEAGASERLVLDPPLKGNAVLEATPLRGGSFRQTRFRGPSRAECPSRGKAGAPESVAFEAPLEHNPGFKPWGVTLGRFGLFGLFGLFGR